MKIPFLLDITNDKRQITVPNGRALEILPQQLQLKQTRPGETWLAFPVDEKGYNPLAADAPVYLLSNSFPFEDLSSRERAGFGRTGFGKGDPRRSNRSSEPRFPCSTPSLAC
jgi:hypothetical protein